MTKNESYTYLLFNDCQKSTKICVNGCKYTKKTSPYFDVCFFFFFAAASFTDFCQFSVSPASLCVTFVFPKLCYITGIQLLIFADIRFCVGK